jgi:hypothetical protein
LDLKSCFGFYFSLNLSAENLMSINFSGSYSQDFDTLATSTSNLWVNDATLTGWFLFNSLGSGTAITTYAAGNGSSTTGSFYSFGIDATSERALGAVGSGGAYFGSPATGNVAGWIAFAATNTTGSSITSVDVRFDGEQWRDSGAATVQTMILQYGFGSAFDSVSSWITPGGNFDWNSPVSTSTPAPVNGNGVGLVANRGGTLSGLEWTNGQTLWFRWADLNDVGNDHGLAIDNFALSIPTVAVPIVTMSATDAEASETGSDPSLFTITRTGDTSNPLTIAYSLSGGASNGNDYNLLPTTTTIAAGQSSVTLTVTPIDDGLDEPAETVVVTLIDTPDYNLSGNSSAIAIIADNDPTPTLTIQDAQVSEDAGQIIFTVRLDAASGQTVTVNYETSNHTSASALAGLDYTPIPASTLTFAPGDTQKFITVSVSNDSLVEASETFQVNLSGAVNAEIVDSQGLGIIQDNDALPNITIADLVVNESASRAIFTVSLDAASAQTVTVNYQTVNRDALVPLDYANALGRVTFNPGETQQQITVSIVNDALDERDETFQITLFGATNGAIADSVGVATIQDDDAPPTIAITDVTVNESAGQAIFTVRMNTVSGKTVTLNYLTNDDDPISAIAGTDYQAIALRELMFLPGESQRFITVNIANDTIFNEPDETFQVTLVNATNAVIADSQGIGTIHDTVKLPMLAISDSQVSELLNQAVFTISLDVVSSQTVSVAYQTVDGEAIAPDDYVSASGQVMFVPGETQKLVTVAIAPDEWNEIDETFQVSLTGAINAELADSQGIGTIQDNDPTPNLLIDDLSVNEAIGQARVTVRLDAPSGQTVTVNYETENNTAISPDDYGDRSGSLTFTPGQTQQVITLDIVNDQTFERRETLTINLSNASAGTIMRGQGTVTLLNDDAQPKIGIRGVRLREGDRGTKFAKFNVTLSNPSSQKVMVRYETADGLAKVSSGDYDATQGSLVFRPGETQKTIRVGIHGDTQAEKNESFALKLRNSSTNQIARATAKAVILNDDALRQRQSLNTEESTKERMGDRSLSFPLEKNLFGYQAWTDDLVGGVEQDSLTRGAGQEAIASFSSPQTRSGISMSFQENWTAFSDLGRNNGGSNILPHNLYIPQGGWGVNNDLRTAEMYSPIENLNKSKEWQDAIANVLVISNVLY